MRPKRRGSRHRLRGDGLLRCGAAEALRAFRARRPTRHGMSAVAALSTLAVTVIGGLNAVPASAKLYPCSPYGENYYGEACLSGSFHGVAGTIRSDELSRGSTGFVDNDMWIVHSAESPHWIEAGLMENESTIGPQFFWADDRPCCGFYTHLGGSAFLATGYGDKIYYKGSETWSVEVGSFSGTSTSNPLSPNLVRTGTEETPQTAANVCSEQYNLEWLNPETNQWHSGWTNSTGEAALNQSEPPYAWWENKNYWLRDRTKKPECYGI